MAPSEQIKGPQIPLSVARNNCKDWYLRMRWSLQRPLGWRSQWLRKHEHHKGSDSQTALGSPGTRAGEESPLSSPEGWLSSICACQAFWGSEVALGQLVRCFLSSVTMDSGRQSHPEEGQRGATLGRVGGGEQRGLRKGMRAARLFVFCRCKRKSCLRLGWSPGREGWWLGASMVPVGTSWGWEPSGALRTVAL